MASQQLQVLTYNIHKGFSPGRLRFILPKMREALHDLSTDLVFLQEVQGEHKRQEKRIQDWPETSQFEFLAEQLWPHYAYGKNAIYAAGHHGNAILSKYPFSECENINVSAISRASRSLLHGVLNLSEGSPPVHVLCIHLGLFKAEREEQLKILADRIKAHVGMEEPLIIAGDFNDWRKEATDYLEAELNLREVIKELEGEHAKTYPAWRPTLLFDRIYYRGLKLLEGHCLQGNPWRLLSDHLPLYAKFELPFSQ